jgi:hypothetical protein
MAIIEATPKEFATIIAATFPDYRRKKVWLKPTGRVTFSDLNWSGGTRMEYRACTIDGQPLGSAARFNAMAPWDPQQIEGKTIEVPPGAVMVSAGHFCGKASVLSITCNPADMPKLLPNYNTEG